MHSRDELVAHWKADYSEFEHMQDPQPALKLLANLPHGFEFVINTFGIFYQKNCDTTYNCTSYQMDPRVVDDYLSLKIRDDRLDAVMFDFRAAVRHDPDAVYDLSHFLNMFLSTPSDMMVWRTRRLIRVPNFFMANYARHLEILLIHKQKKLVYSFQRRVWYVMPLMAEDVRLCEELGADH
jgi:hypothetical protein